MAMTGKERVFAALRHETPDAVPWVPFVGVHAGKLKGYNATEMLTDVDKLVDALLAVNQLYMPDGQPVVPISPAEYSDSSSRSARGL